jgi:hypothetical protein
MLITILIKTRFVEYIYIYKDYKNIIKLIKIL